MAGGTSGIVSGSTGRGPSGGGEVGDGQTNASENEHTFICI